MQCKLKCIGWLIYAGCAYWLPIGRLVAQDGWLGPKVGGHLALCFEPSELSQWLGHDDSTVNVVIGIINLLLFIYYYCM